ncbi:MAG TPA: class I SAM-dependent methyltransferase [Nitrospiraceae bacterium]|nr:class I SAM-dependent methyltransferase [Nitrospiraceae bacterium]
MLIGVLRQLSLYRGNHAISSPRDAVARTSRAYHDHRERFLQVWGKNPYRRPPLLADLLRRTPRTAYLLDLGCGAGQDTRAIRRAGFRVVGLDINHSLLDYARRRSPRLTLVQADIRNLPYVDGAFDGLWAAASLIHLPKISVRASFRRLAELTKPGGLFAATLVHGRHSGTLQTGWIPGRFISRWQKQELVTALGRAGWEMLELKMVSGQERKGRWLNLLARRPT